ncbi:MAG: hypothetical protein JST38_08885 [Bacteroidetes bacterium]|nr:hypothetical protein [Bacteroidota bacterium]
MAPRRQRRRLLWRATQRKHRRRLAWRIRSEKFTRSGNIYTPTGGVQQDLAYQYDLGGNIIGIRDKAPANHSSEGPGDLLKQFSYDPLKRLLTATGRESTAPSALPLWDAGVRAHDHTATNTYTRTYTYDKVGNVLQEQHTADGHPANSFTKQFNYHPTGAHNRLESYEMGALTFPLTYDANGNQLKETTSRFHQWDHADQLKYFMVQAGGAPPSVWAHYFYDTAGTRVKKVVSKPGGILEVTVYIDGFFEETYVQTGGVIDPDRHYNTLHVMDGRSRIATIRVGNDVEDPTPAIKYNLEDHLGTSSVMVDSSGNLINREEYYPPTLARASSARAVYSHYLHHHERTLQVRGRPCTLHHFCRGGLGGCVHPKGICRVPVTELGVLPKEQRPAAL